MIATFKKTIFAAGLLATLCGTSAQAALGDDVYASGGPITVTFLGAEAGYDSTISVNGGSEFFPNHSTAAGSTYALGSFSAGTLLDIQLTVLTTGDKYHTGPGSGNPDGLAHADVIYNYLGVIGTTYVGFEDIYGGGDKDYNDHTFSFTMTQAVPEPETYALMLAGLGAIGFIARRRKAA